MSDIVERLRRAHTTGWAREAAAEIERLRGMSDIVGRLRTERNQLELKVGSLEAEIVGLQAALLAHKWLSGEDGEP